MASFKVLIILSLGISVSLAANVTKKRGVFDGNFGGGFQSYGPNPNDVNFEQSIGPLAYGGQPPVIFNKGPSNNHPDTTANQHNPISSAEIAAAISAAREASAQVNDAQNRVHAARDAVIHQQRIASAKASHAALLRQRTETAAAVQRQEAHAAATAVVLAQQRLAQAKSDVAQQQRDAAIKESRAAAVIQRSAAAAAAELQRSEHTASKLAALQRTENNALKQIQASKDAHLSAAAAAVAASVNHYGNGAGHSGPWYGAGKFISVPWN